MKQLRILIVWDGCEDIAYQVCKRSLELHSSISLDIIPIEQDELRSRALYWGEPDALPSTEFSFTRFLTPYLAGYRGSGVFVDCDFLFRKDIAGLLDYRDPSKALYCVQHDYRPTESSKMDGQIQTQYRGKNWSNFMLINCAHEQVHARTPDAVNTNPGLYLHRFNWLTDNAIDALPVTWNYLEEWHSPEDCADPLAAQVTRGGPSFDAYQTFEYGHEWTLMSERCDTRPDPLKLFLSPHERNPPEPRLLRNVNSTRLQQ